MTHRERIHEAERAVIEAAKEWNRSWQAGESTVRARNAVDRSVDALLALEAQTCPKCDGHGDSMSRYGDTYKCEGNCDHGRVRP